MSQEFQVFAADGSLQATSDLVSYKIRYTGTGTTQSRLTGNTNPSSLVVPYTGNYANSFVALSLDNGYGAAACGIVDLNGQYEKHYISDAPAGTGFRYYVFDMSSAITPTNFGLETFNAAGQLTFSSNHQVMSILDVLSEGGSATHGGRTLAFFQGAFAGHRYAGTVLDYGSGGGPSLPEPDDGQPGGGGDSGYHDYKEQQDGKLYGGCVTNGGQTVSAVQISFDDVLGELGNDPTPPPDWEIPLTLFVVDVTGIPLGASFF